MLENINKKIADTTIVVAMSGGVDSSVTAAILNDYGYKVIGVTLQLYNSDEISTNSKSCCAGRDIADAQNVCKTLGIPHYILNYEDIFKQEVIDDFADSYIRGETPIPCVKCNQSVKFRDLYKVAKNMRADGLATGHYITRKQGNYGAELHQGKDQGKDQSYFLFATTNQQLEYLHFPIGNMDKNDVRKLAKKYNLTVADKSDSQDICFVQNGSYKDIIAKLRPEAMQAGDIIHIDTDEIIGQHQGIINYTVGQRKGLDIAHSEPLYVIKINADNAQVFVGERQFLGNKTVHIKDTNWLMHEQEQQNIANMELTVKLRSSQKTVPATINLGKNNTAIVELQQSDITVTPGQACVVYHDSRILGGGWITVGV